jgi:hypothetical protein
MLCDQPPHGGRLDYTKPRTTPCGLCFNSSVLIVQIRVLDKAHRFLGHAPSECDSRRPTRPTFSEAGGNGARAALQS